MFYVQYGFEIKWKYDIYIPREYGSYYYNIIMLTKKDNIYEHILFVKLYFNIYWIHDVVWN